MVDWIACLARQQVDDPVVDLTGDAQDRALRFRWPEFVHLNGVARPPQDATIGNDVTPDIEEACPGPSRLDQPAHHLPSEIGEQDLALIHRVEDSAFAKRCGKHLALRLQRLDLLPDEACLIFSEVKKSAGKKSQRQYVDGEDPAR